MTLEWFLSFVGLAAVYAGLATALFIGAARRLNLCASWRAAPLMLVTLFFIFLTQHPFPNPATLDCPMPSATPQLTLFNFRGAMQKLYATGATPLEWLGHRTILATLMNLIVCMGIGAALTRHLRTAGVAALFGATLSLTVEVTQLTGLWGLYPCAYRQFNVDDLFMNVLGVFLGFLMGQWWRKRPGLTARSAPR